MASIDVEMLKAAMQNRREDGFEPEATTEIAERGRAGIFNLFDKDRSGHIDTRKLGACFAVLGIQYTPDLLKVCLKEFDSDKNNTLEPAEFSELVGMLQSCRDDKKNANTEVSFSEAQLAKFRAAFDSLDVDGSGNIDASELALALEALGIDAGDPDTISQMIEMIDVDGDKEVNFDEFLTLMQMSELAKDGDGNEVSIQALVKDSLLRHHARAREATRVIRVGVTAALDAHFKDEVMDKGVCGEIADAVTRAAGGSADDGEAARAQAMDAVQEAIDESLCRASEKGKLDELERAVENGARVNAARKKATPAAAGSSSQSAPPGQTALHLANATQQLACASRLLALGAVPTLADEEGWTPLILASKSHEFDRAPKAFGEMVAACAREACAAIDAELGAEAEKAAREDASKGIGRKKKLDTNALAAQQARRSDVEQAAIEAAVRMSTRSGFTALHAAVTFGRLNTVATLLRHRADVNAVTEDGTTPLMRAAALGLQECIELLLKAGADPARRDVKGTSALDQAERAEQTKAQEILKRALAEPSTADPSPGSARRKSGAIVPSG